MERLISTQEITVVRDLRHMTLREWTSAVVCGACVLVVTAQRLLADAGTIDGNTSLSASLVMSIVVWIVGAILTYGAVNARLSVIETKQQDSAGRLVRIEEQLDQLLERRRHDRP